MIERVNMNKSVAHSKDAMMAARQQIFNQQVESPAIQGCIHDCEFDGCMRSAVGVSDILASPFRMHGDEYWFCDLYDSLFVPVPEFIAK